jgi:hypothetical protein
VAGESHADLVLWRCSAGKSITLKDGVVSTAEHCKTGIMTQKCTDSVLDRASTQLIMDNEISIRRHM